MRRALATRPCTRPQMLAANQMLLTRREPQHMFLVYFCPPRSTSSATHSITNSALATSAPSRRWFSRSASACGWTARFDELLVHMWMIWQSVLSRLPLMHLLGPSFLRYSRQSCHPSYLHLQQFPGRHFVSRHSVTARRSRLT